MNEDIKKEIREIIHTYCGGNYENRRMATELILQKCQEKQLTLTDVSKRNLLDTDVKCKHPSGTRKGRLEYHEDGETLILRYKGGFINIPDLSNCYVC
tara:strand:+ start:969 stop:1262 length:294 start_codon:yes stop_codon:yes gene_type:complete